MANKEIGNLINKKAAALALVGTMAIAGCGSTDAKTSTPTQVPPTSPSGEGAPGATPTLGETQGAANVEGLGNTVVTVGEKSGTLVELFGGQADQWWPNQLPDGSLVPSSWVLVDRRTSDSELPGVDFKLPKGVVADLWVDHNGDKEAMKAMGADGAMISGEFKVARGTVYLVAADWKESLAGQWADSDGAKGLRSDWVNINTEPTISAEGAAAGQKAYDGESTTNSGGSDNTGDSSWQDNIRAEVEKSRLEQLSDGGLKIKPGEVITLSLDGNDKIVYWNGKEVVTTTGPATVKTGEATVYENK